MTSETTLQDLHQKLQQLSVSHNEDMNKRLSIASLQRLCNMLLAEEEKGTISDEAMRKFSEAVHAIKDETPILKDEMKVFDRTFADLKKSVKKEYNWIYKGYYLGLSMSLGVAFGISFGTLIFDENFLLGMPFGLALGVAIGASLESRAKNEGRLY